MDTNPLQPPVKTIGRGGLVANVWCSCEPFYGKLLSMDKKIPLTKIERVHKLKLAGVPNTKIAKRFGVHRNTITRWLKVSPITGESA